jgi:hypothetical protein
VPREAIERNHVFPLPLIARKHSAHAGRLRSIERCLGGPDISQLGTDGTSAARSDFITPLSWANRKNDRKPLLSTWIKSGFFVVYWATASKAGCFEGLEQAFERQKAGEYPPGMPSDARYRART